MGAMKEMLLAKASDALDVAQAGWPVFPCDGKRPLTRHGFKDASTDVDTILDWWARFPWATVGVALPPGTIAVDVDDIDAFAATGLDLPLAPQQRTPSGGLHRFYRLAEDTVQTVRAHDGVDTRVGGRGYVIAWEPAAFTSADLPDAPDWVYE